MVKISTDSTCDLPQSVFEQLNIDVLPLTINCGDKSYKDGIDVKPDDVYRYVEEENVVCMTSAINSYEYQELFERQLKEYDTIVHLCISSDMSACYQNACVAAEEFNGKVFVVDARNLSSGIGLLVIKAAEMAKEGRCADEILSRINELLGKVEASFVVNTMDYLKRGGRCSALQAFGAAVLKIRPCIGVVDGKMIVATTYR
ncbi:MAG: DegV family protein, partial [Clostridiales bacterium]|nr:DegV family protein [Clostridiales bacterium]